MLERILHLYGTPFRTQVQAHCSIFASIFRAYYNQTVNIPRSLCQDWQACCKLIAIIVQSHAIIRKHIHMAVPPYVHDVDLLLHTICSQTSCNHIAIILQAYGNQKSVILQLRRNNIAVGLQDQCIAFTPNAFSSPALQ